MKGSGFAVLALAVAALITACDRNQEVTDLTDQTPPALESPEAVVEPTTAPTTGVTPTHSPATVQPEVTPTAKLVFLRFNTSVPPFDDATFLQALSHAVDLDELADILSGLLTSIPGCVSPPDFPPDATGFEDISYDPSAAQQLLAESRYPNPSSVPEFQLATVRDLGFSQTNSVAAEYLAAKWEDLLGIRIELLSTRWNLRQAVTDDLGFERDVSEGRWESFVLGGPLC